MRACPFCAEDIQDAAVVCKHCGKNLPAVAPVVLPRVTPASRASGRDLILAILAIAGGLAMLAAFIVFMPVPAPHAVRPTVSLHAEISANDVIVSIKNPTKDTFESVRISATEGPDDDFTYEKTLEEVPAYRTVTVALRDLVTPSGRRFDPIALKLRAVRITAVVNGEPASGTFRFK